jgi:hypothetical protein
MRTEFLLVKPEGNRPLGIHRFRREDNIKLDLKEKFGADWIHQA